MTIEAEYERLKGAPIVATPRVSIFAPRSLRPFVSIESADRDAVIDAFKIVTRNLNNIAPASDEPMMNVIANFDAGRLRVIVLPRLKHRPSFFTADGDARILLSPGTVDIGGVCILPLERDFQNLRDHHLQQMLEEVMLPPEPFSRLSDALAAVIK
jgi:hypothetical protein